MARARGVRLRREVFKPFFDKVYNSKAEVTRRLLSDGDVQRYATLY